MSIRYRKIQCVVFALLVFTFIVSCSRTTTEPSEESRDSAGDVMFQKSADDQDWDIVFTDLFRDTWRFNKVSESQGYILFQGEYIRYDNIFLVGALYNTETRSFTASVKYSIGSTEYIMIESLTYYGDGKFYGKYAYANKAIFGSDRFTITENSIGIIFKPSESERENFNVDDLLLKRAESTREQN